MMACAGTDREMPKFMVGTCLGMCPNAEIRLRQKEGLIHILEKAHNITGDIMDYGNPRYMVKEFSRSAAGREIVPSDIRPYPVLAKTVKFLLTNSCCRSDVTWAQIYDFVNDRLRAARQDMCIQGLKKVDYVHLPSVRFYAFAHYRMCEHDLAEFDPYLNLKNLSETLALILSSYQDTDKDIEGPSSRSEYEVPHEESELERTEEGEGGRGGGQESEEKIRNDAEANEKNGNAEHGDGDFVTNFDSLNLEENLGTNDTGTGKDAEKMSLQKELESRKGFTCREEAEALYILVNFGNEEALIHALGLPQHIRSSPLVKLVMEMGKAWLIHNYSRVLRLSTLLPPLFLCVFHQHLAFIERTTLAILSRSHSCKGQFYNKEDLSKLLFFSDCNSLIEACCHFGINVTDSGVSFNKASFKADAPLRKLRRLGWINDKIDGVFLAELLIPPYISL